MNNNFERIDYNHELCHKMLQDLSFQTQQPQISQPNIPQIQLEVQLQNGTKVIIIPQPNDEPQQLAQHFCKLHDLDSQMVDILAESIKKSIFHSQESSHLHNEPKHFPHQQCHKTEPSIEKRIQSKEYQKDPIADLFPYSCQAKNSKLFKPHYFSKKSSLCSQISLYQKGRIQAEQHKNWVERQRRSKQKQEIKQCTHIPQINRLSRSMASERSLSKLQKQLSDKQQENIRTSNVICHSMIKPFSQMPSICHSVILNQAGKIQKPQQKVRYQFKQVKEPNLKRINSDIFIELYQNRKSHITSQQQRQKDNTHRPKIDSVSKQIVGNSKFSERLLKYEQNRLLKNQIRKKSIAEQKENLYKPKIGAPPLSRNVDKLPIGDYLFSKKRKTPMLTKPLTVPKINKSSKIIYDKCKDEAFSHVQKQRKVSWNHIKIQNIEKNLQQILFPLLEQIQIMQIQLNQSDFKVALQFLFNTLSPNHKHILLNFSSQKNIQSDKHTVQSQMNKKSERLVKKSSRAQMDIYDYCEMKQAMRQRSIQSNKIAKERKQMEQCSFHPKIEKRMIY